MRRFLASILATCAVVLPGPAYAASPSCYVEVGAGGALSQQQLTDAGASVTIAGDGYTAGGGIGCDVKFDQVLIGAFGRYDFQHLTGSMAGESWKSDAQWTVAMRAGYFVQPSILLYGVVGMQGTEIDYAGLTTLDTKGLLLGGGLELEIAKHVALFAQYEHTQFGGWKDGTAELKPATDAVRIGVRIRFNSLLPQ